MFSVICLKLSSPKNRNLLTAWPILVMTYFNEAKFINTRKYLLSGSNVLLWHFSYWLSIERQTNRQTDRQEEQKDWETPFAMIICLTDVEWVGLICLSVQVILQCHSSYHLLVSFLGYLRRWKILIFLVFHLKKKPIFILLTHKGSHREVYQEFQPSYDIIFRWCQGLFRSQVPCTPSLHCPTSSASTRNQQPV